MSLLGLVFMFSFTLTIFSIILLIKNHRRIMKGEKVDGHFTIHHNTWDDYIGSGKELLKWSSICFILSGIILILINMVENIVS